MALSSTLANGSASSLRGTEGGKVVGTVRYSFTRSAPRVKLGEELSSPNTTEQSPDTPDGRLDEAV